MAGGRGFPLSTALGGEPGGKREEGGGEVKRNIAKERERRNWRRWLARPD